MRRSSNARGLGRIGTEYLGVDAISRDAQRCKTGSQVAHENRGSADIEVTVAWQIEFLKHSCIQAPRSVEINIGPILGTGRAVANVAVMVGKCFEQSTSLPGKRMFAAATGSV